MPRRIKSRDEARTRLTGFQKAAKRFESWRPAAEVLTRVRALPTIFPQFNRATRVGGYPIQRFGLVHGPSNHGKTIFVHGLGLSFLTSGNWYAYVDAEYTTPEDWLVKLMAEQAHNPAFVAQRPKSYEETVEGVREFCLGIKAARDAGEVGPETTALIAIDSIRKLVPERLMEKIAKGEGGVDGASGRAAQYRAALNAAWLDELTPLLYHTNTAMIFVARESENTEQGNNAPDFKVGGGRAPVYDSSLVMRVSRASWLKEGSSKEKESADEKNARIIGEQHRVRITKTKVGGKDGMFTDCFFHTTPAGFDRARDVAELAIRLGAIDQNGAWYSFEGTRIGQGINNAVSRIRDDAALMKTLESRFEWGDGEMDDGEVEKAAI